MSDAIEARHITVRRGSVLAVDAISISVPQASWFGVIGANGSGKTSLLRALSGRLPCEMESCLVEGQDLSANMQLRAEQIGFMAPSEYLPGPLTCRQVFTLIEPDESVWKPRLGAVWQAVALERLLEKRIATCSAGMRQRIALGAAFLSGNRIVILDEPFNWLDPVAAMDLRIALRDQVDNGLTLMTALHDMITLIACDQGILLGQGKIVKALSRDDIATGRQAPFAFEQELIAQLRLHSIPD